MSTRIRITALAIAGLTVAIFVSGILMHEGGVARPDVLATIGNLLSVVAIGTFLAFPAMGLLVVRHRPRNAVGWLLLGLGLTVYLIFNSANLAVVARQGHVVAATDVFAFLAGTAWIPFTLMLLLFLPLLFPDGRLPSRRWWLPIISGAIFAVMALLGNMFVASNPAPGEPAVLNPLANPSLAHAFQPFINLAVPFGLVALLGSWTSVVVRYRRGDSLQRHQLRWFFFALVLAATPFLLHDVNQTVANSLLLVCVPLLPVSIAVAVLRYRLYDIDVVINRTLVYGTLLAFITAVYVGIVVGVGSLIGSGSRPNLFLSIVATAVVAVAFQPVRERVQRFGNRLVYGKRATPYEVMANFSERMADTLAPDDVLPRMAEVAARGVGAEAARVGVRFRDGSHRVVWWPADHSEAPLDGPVPIDYRGEGVGDIAVAKPPGAPVTPAEAKLLTDLAAQAGLVVHNIRLTTELRGHLVELTAQAEAIRASRQRLVSAATAERERLQQTIRDGAERALTILGDKLRGVEVLLDADPAQAALALEGLNGEVQQALDGLRQLAHGLYPPLLRDQGLIAALRSQTAKAAVPVEIVTRSVGRYAAEIESAIYFASLEVIRFAQGVSRVEVTGGNGAVHFSVVAPGWAGHSVQAIEDRVEALGGHLQSSDHGVAGTIPVSPEVLQPASS